MVQEDKCMPWKEMLAGKATIGYEEEQDYYAEGAEEEWEWDPESELWLNTAAINKNSGVKCRKCGKTGHMQKDCNTNMGRVKCFKCGQSGHIGANCQASSPKSASSSPSSSTGKGSGAAKAKPAAKAERGKGGRKGKMHEVSAEGPQEEEQESGEAIMMPLISSQVSSSEGTCRLLDSGAVQVTGQHLRQILAEFGLLETLEGPPVDFRTDAQDEVGTVLRRSGLPREYTVNKAGPQNHDTVGSVERGVREVKEALAVLRLELAKAGLDLVDSLVAWEAASRYVTAMHNLHGKIQNTGKTGKELLRNTSEGTRISAMFCSRVLAETPESVDSIGRFVTAAYLYPVRNSFAHFVCAKIADELKFFQAKSLKLVFPIEHPQDLIERFVCHSGSGDRPSLVDQAPIEICQRILHDFQNRCSLHGIGLMLMDELKDAVHVPLDKADIPRSAASAIRYWNWIRNRKKGERPALPDKPEEQPPRIEPNDPAVAVPSRPLPRIPGLPAGMTPTRRCPSCESGMNAPGTRHSAECRQRQAEFVSGETAKPSLGDLEDMPVQEGGVRDGSYSPSLAPDPVEPADVEMATENVGDMPMFDVCMAQPYHVGMLTSPELVQRDRFSVESIQYNGYCDEFVVMDFCGQKIKLWKPSGAVSDVTLRDLPAEGTFLAMQKEIRGLTAVGAGQVLAENVARESGQRIIGTRWVTNEKEEAQEGARRILQVDSLPEVWASVAQHPALKLSGWFLELPVGRGVLGIKPCFWQVWTFLRRS